jgi:hypothetical protein
MSAQPARRTPSTRPARAGSAPGQARPQPAPRSADRAVRLERRRRELHLRRRRRDLLEDFGMALALMILALVLTAGLGVIALLEVPIGGGVIGSYIVERRKRRRSAGSRGRPS